MTHKAAITESNPAISVYASKRRSGIDDGLVIDQNPTGNTPACHDSMPSRDVCQLADVAGVDPASLSDVQIMEALYQMR